MIYVLTYSPGEDDAALHGEEREPFDGIGVLGSYATDAQANQAIDEDRQKRPGLGIQYMIDGREQMAYPTLADLMQQDKTIEVKCPRCKGIVTVPTQVTVVRQGRTGTIDRYEPQAKCHRCNVGFAWYDGTRQRPPAGDLSGSRAFYKGWFCDRPLLASEPEVVPNA